MCGGGGCCLTRDPDSRHFSTEVLEHGEAMPRVHLRTHAQGGSSRRMVATGEGGRVPATRVRLAERERERESQTRRGV